MSYSSNPINQSFDFTGTDYDTKAKCNAAKIWFNDDVDCLFPTSLGIYTAFGGTWAYTADTGWLSSGQGDDQIAGFIIKLERGDWQADLYLDFEPAADGDEVAIILGGLTPSNHLGAFARMLDINAAASELVCILDTNDGDDSYTNQYVGAALAGTGNRIYKFKSINSVLSVYDDLDDSWHEYEGHQVAGLSYSYSHVFVGVYKYTEINLAPVYLQKLDITYLANSEI